MTTPSILDDRLLDKVQVAELFKCSVSRVDKWVTLGGGPRFVKIGVRVFFRESELNRYIAAQTHDSTHRPALAAA